MTSTKTDLKKTLKPFFTASKKDFEQVDLPPANYLMIDGQGAPAGEAYLKALSVLFPAAYGLKFHSKVELERDYVVPPLEGLWWSDDRSAFVEGRREEWRWTMMLMVPEWIKPENFDAAMELVAKKKKGLDFSPVRMEALSEGSCLQMLHLGSYADEAPILHRLHNELMPQLGLTWNGHHHEIYMNDPRKTPPEKLKTILRQPVKPAP